MPLYIVNSNIADMNVDAVVNSTNEEMIGYSGVDLAIHKGAGPLLDAECNRIAPLGLGTAKITSGYNLKAKYIIHTSGPVWEGGLNGESIILKSCYLESLKLAVENNCESVAFPLISSGAYGYPKNQVLSFAVQTISEFLDSHELTVYICVIDRSSYEISNALYKEICDALKVERELFQTVSKAFSSDNSIRENEVALTENAQIERFTFSEKKCNLHRLEVNYQNAISIPTGKDLNEYLKSRDKSFAERVFELIDKKGMTDVELYKKANVDRKTFSKMKSNPVTYRPSKSTAVAFAMALELSLDETQELLGAAGLALSGSYRFDMIIIFFLQKKMYDIDEINMILYDFDEVCLGSYAPD